MYVFLGGSFDPVHLGHLRIATELSELTGSGVHLMPCKAPVHKPASSSTTNARLRMLRLASGGDSNLRIDLREISSTTESFTIHSIRDMKKEGLSPVVMAIGTDSAMSFPTWRDAEAFASLCHVIVLKRPDYDDSETAKAFELLGYEVVRSPEALKNKDFGCVLFHSASQLQISSSDIRYRVEQNLSIRYLVPDAVEQFICDNGLYRP